MKKWIVGLVQVGLTIALGWTLAVKVGISGTVEQASRLPFDAACGFVLLIATQFFIISWRLQLVLKALGHRCSFWACLRSNFAGGFVSQTPLTVVGGDLVRLWVLSTGNVPLQDAASAVAVDRLLGMTALLMLVLLSAVPLWLMLNDSNMQLGLVAGILIALLGLAGVLLLRLLPEWSRRSRIVHWATEMAGALGRILVNRHYGIWTLGLGICSHLVSITITYGIARALGASLTIVDCLILAPFPLFLSALPISLGGWGVREGALVVAFGLVGVPSQMALAISVLFGLSILAATLPGGLVLLERALVSSRQTRKASISS